MNKLSLSLLLVMVVSHAVANKQIATPLAGDSLYQLQIPLTNQQGQRFNLSHLRGRPQLVTMFYSSCRYSCPLIIDTLRTIDNDLGKNQAAQIDFLLVSFDAAHDQVAALATLAAERKLSSPHWQLTRTDATHVRELAAALNVQYRQLTDGEFNHASVITLLDREGRIIKHTNKLTQLDAEFMTAVKAVIGNGSVH